MRIAVMRTGTVTRWDGSKASPSGGNRDVLGLVRYLATTSHDVAIFGANHGETPVGTKNLNTLPHLEGMTDSSLVSEWDEAYAKCNADLEAWKPDVAVMIVGACPTTSIPGNQFATNPQCWAARYLAPALKAIEHCKIPRVCIVNDPRQIPKDHEMHYMPWLRPAAILSQRSTVGSRSMRGEKQLVHEVHCGAENWWSFGKQATRPDECERTVPVGIIAHTHHEDGRVGFGRMNLWEDVLKRCVGEVKVWGKGWDTTAYAHLHQGVMPQEKLDTAYTTFKSGAMMPMAEGFLTAKLREYALAGAMPRLITDSARRLTYDPDCVYVPRNSPARLFPGEPWGSRVWEDEVARIEEVTRPSFVKLEQCLRDIELITKDKQLETFRSKDWCKNYGGLLCA